MIPPTEENLIRYEEWVMSSNQSEVFFGDLVPDCYVASINQGNTLFIPTGQQPPLNNRNTLLPTGQICTANQKPLIRT